MPKQQKHFVQAKPELCWLYSLFELVYTRYIYV